MIYGNAIGGTAPIKTLTIVDESNNEYVGVVTGSEVIFTATDNDVRAGFIYASNEGISTGTKDIPAYSTIQGRRTIKPGQQLIIPLYSDACQYTKLQVIVCAYNTSAADSLAAQAVVIEDKLYEINSAEAIATVTVDIENQSINLGIINNGDTSLILRYMTIKEDTLNE